MLVGRFDGDFDRWNEGRPNAPSPKELRFVELYQPQGTGNLQKACDAARKGGVTESD